MNQEERFEYVQFRIESAYQTYDAAKSLFENEFWNSSVNRLYYAIFYAVNALLVLNKIETKTHSSVKSQFSLHFIKTKRLDKKYGQLLNILFDLRQKGDYENMYNYDKESVEPLIEKVGKMLQIIENEIKNVITNQTQINK